MKRKGISKSIRFSIFSRDAFTCRYCGRGPDEVKLVIDHLLAVAKGGTNDEENLVTSCEPCNQGKSDKPATAPEGGDAARMSRLQQLREQREAAQSASDCLKARKKFRQAVIDAWCGLTGRNTVDTGTITVVCNYVEEHTFNVVMGWMEKAVIRAPYCDKKMGRYISGIRRHVMEDGWK